jgi:hypothetical protein
LLQISNLLTGIKKDLTGFILIHRYGERLKENLSGLIALQT